MIYQGKKIDKNLSYIIANKLIPTNKNGEVSFVASPIAKAYNVDEYTIVPSGEKFVVASREGDVFVLSAEELDNKFAEVNTISVLPVAGLAVNVSPGAIGDIFTVNVDIGNDWRRIAEEIKIPEIETKGDTEIIDEVLEYYSKKVSSPSIQEVMVEFDGEAPGGGIDVSDPLNIGSRITSGVYLPFYTPQLEAETLKMALKLIRLFDLEELPF